MIVGILSVSVHIPGSHSLKDKRQVIKSLIDKTRNRFNIAMAEIGDQELWQKALFGVVCIANERKFVNQILDKVLNFIRSVPLISLIDYQIEIL